MNTYSVPKSDSLEEKLATADELKKKIDEQRPLKEDLWQTIQEKLRVSWTHNSNAIEGSTLNYGETLFFLQYGLTVEGKPFKDFLDARNHANAIDMLAQVVNEEREITQGLIKEINAILLLGVDCTDAVTQYGQKIKKPATPGQYKQHPNHVLLPNGNIHHYAEPLVVPEQMEKLCQWIQEQVHAIHPVLVGGLAHYNFVRTHPFDDGNGRGARILMNLILMQRKYYPAIIRNEKRRQYIKTLQLGNQGNLVPFIEFIADSLIETEETILSDFDA